MDCVPGTFQFFSKPLQCFTICGMQSNVTNEPAYKKPAVPGFLTSQPPSPYRKMTNKS